jgi:L-asparagine transporter-like permease
MYKIRGILTGALIGTLLGFFADQFLTSYVLQHTENAFAIIMTNALSAFLMFPLLIILSAYIGYRMANRKRAKHAHPISST